MLAILLPLLATLPAPIQALHVGAGAPSTVALVITPSVRPATTGATDTLSASWGPLPPACNATAQWYRWAVVAGSSAGRLRSDAGANVTFIATAQISSNATVEVTAALAVACAGATSSLVGHAHLTLAVSAPLVVSGIRVSPDPAPADGEVTLAGDVVGGEPPYFVAARWSGGEGATALVPRAGPFAVGVVLGAGTYHPTVSVRDTTGAVATGSLGAPLLVTDGFAISVVPGSAVADTGVPDLFSIASTGATGPLQLALDCGNGSPGMPVPGTPPATYECIYGTAGTRAVRAVGSETTPPYAAASTQRNVTVTAAPVVAESGGEKVGEVGEPLSLPVELTGGVPPFTVAWHLVGTALSGSEPVQYDGAIPLAYAGTRVGTDTVMVGVTDALGDSSSVVPIVVVLFPPLSVAMTATGGLANGTPSLDLAGTIAAGAPPYDWTVVPDGENASTFGGVLLLPGPFAWSGAVVSEGPVGATVYVVDAAGGLFVAPLSATPVAPLALGPLSVTFAGGAWNLSFAIEGGLGPYQVWVNASDGSAWNGSWTDPGVRYVTAPFPGGGHLILTVVVVDRIAAVARASGTFAGPSTSGPVGPWAAVALAAGIAAAAIVLLWWVVPRWRRRAAAAAAPPPAGPDVEATLREIIAAVDGTDRATVELLAAEAGAPVEEVRRTLDRLIADGTVRSGPGDAGEEILAWEALP